jgi:hypothetical protein
MLKIEGYELDLYPEFKFKISYKPGRQPIPCSDPSKPEFYDYGEDPEMTVDIYLLVDGVEYDLYKISPELYDEINRKYEQKLHDLAEKKYSEVW